MVVCVCYFKNSTWYITREKFKLKQGKHRLREKPKALLVRAGETLEKVTELGKFLPNICKKRERAIFLEQEEGFARAETIHTCAGDARSKETRWSSAMIPLFTVCSNSFR